MHTPDPARGRRHDASAAAIGDDAVAVLLVACAGGDRGAWAPLFDVFAPRLLAFFQRTLQDPTSAEQHVEATFIELHRRRHTYRGTSVRPWIFGIAARVRVDGPNRFDRSARNGGGRSAGGGEAGEGACEKQIREALDRLSVPERRAIHLHRFERMNFEEIAEVLGWTEDAVRCQVVHAYRALRDGLWMLSGEEEGQ